MRDPKRDEYFNGTKVTLTAVPDAGYVFDSWAGVSDIDGNTATIVMDAYKMVSAKFKPAIKKANPTDDIQTGMVSKFAPGSNDTWTFMVYLDGDNSLSSYALDDFNEMEQGLYNLNQAGGNDNLKIIVLYDDTSPTEGTRLYRVVPDNTPEIVSTRLDTGNSELAMNDPETLSNFIITSKNDFPADHYALILWDHGGGARSISNTAAKNVQARQIADDWSSGNGDYLFLDEIQQALSSSGFSQANKLDLIGFDACIMGEVETAYEFRDLADVFAASMGDENNDGWDYTNLFGSMAESGGSTGAPVELGKLIVKSYHDTTKNYPDQTFSAVDLSKISNLKTSLDQLAVQIYSENKKEFIENVRDASVHFFNDNDINAVIAEPYYDINDFCYAIINNPELFSDKLISQAKNVLDILSGVIIAAYAGDVYGDYYGSGKEVKRGLSIFFSKGNLMYNNNSLYWYEWWYTDADTAAWFGDNPDTPNPGHLYGLIDFANSNTDKIVETWRELMEAWYDPGDHSGGATPGGW
ncbi:MAG: hypothetical protein GXP33_01910 [Spirochaetes bacterium]|nr:hypothetical protein [Spirochaetota bacterium]